MYDEVWQVCVQWKPVKLTRQDIKFTPNDKIRSNKEVSNIAESIQVKSVGAESGKMRVEQVSLWRDI